MSNTAQSIIRVSGLTKSFGKKEVLKGVDFEVRAGEIFSLLGSNGAGKTTTIKILSTLLKKDVGEVSIAGHDLAKNPKGVRGAISLTGQYAAVDENLTGKENLHLIGKLRHIKDYKQKSDELLTRFELAPAADKRTKAYSGGMRRKLDLAMSLLGDPKIIFLDEPTTGLDPQSRLALWRVIKDLAKSGVTILLTTQYLEEAETLSDYVAVLDNGRVVTAGTVEKLKSILPARKVELTIGSIQEFDKVVDLLDGYQITADRDSLIIAITIDDGIDMLTDILDVLKDNGITVKRLDKRSPSLEDVFLSLIAKSGAQ